MELSKSPVETISLIIYSAVIMTKVIARLYSVHIVNVEQRQVAADPRTKPPGGL